MTCVRVTDGSSVSPALSSQTDSFSEGEKALLSKLR